MSIHIMGIRHHGPGSARNVKDFLETLKPDIVLVEGPPEADDLLQWVPNEELIPPVAMLVYQPDDLKHSSFYPFAAFSPEWQAILYARSKKIHIRFMDLPAFHYFAMDEISDTEKKESEPGSESTEEVISEKVADPMVYLSEAAGYTDREKWWNHMFEYRGNNEQVFEAVAESMQELRNSFPVKENRIEQLREAYMRKIIRQAEKEMFQTIAVICGAWHVPALTNMNNQKDDAEILKGLPKVKTASTWVPWTYNRLSYHSGYGAGIDSPGWYEHVWNYPQDDGSRWIAKVAQLFRGQNMDTSVAHVIEAVRLSQSLAALRNLSKAGLEEMNEACLSVLCNGEDILLSLIHKELIVSNKIGTVPSEIPKPPLQTDIEKLQKKLKLAPTADYKDYTLDLRKDLDLERSIFLHRLQLLEIKWGERSEISGKGTFKEQWRLQWDPSFSIDIIEKGNLGNTVEEASYQYISEKSKEAKTLSDVCVLLESALPAEIPKAVQELVARINNMAALTGDTIQLMEVIPSLTSVSRYGNVRKTDAELVSGIAVSMILRICISLPAATINVNEDAAGHLLDLFFKLNDSINLLQDPETILQWQETLSIISNGKNNSPIVAGYATRLLVDYNQLAGDELIKRFEFAMSHASPASSVAAWLEGFLKGSGTILLIENNLWSVMSNWVSMLDEKIFTEVLPLLRRTFSHFTNAERRKIGERVKAGDIVSNPSKREQDENIDIEKALLGLPIVFQLLGISKKESI